MIYLLHIKKVLQHKYYVFIAGLYLGVPIWQLLLHDLSKFTKAEFVPYAKYFLKDREKYQEISMYAWLHHLSRNLHHWDRWVINSNYNSATAINGKIPMPAKYVREMISDWLGASRLYTGSWDMLDWLDTNISTIKKYMHPETVIKTESFLKIAEEFVLSARGQPNLSLLFKGLYVRLTA